MKVLPTRFLGHALGWALAVTAAGVPTVPAAASRVARGGACDAYVASLVAAHELTALEFGAVSLAPMRAGALQLRAR